MCFYDQRASLSFVTAAVCGGNYTECLRLLLIAERSSSMPTGSFRDEMEGREDKEWRKRVNNYFPFFLSFFLSIHLPTHNPLLRLPSHHFLLALCPCLPLLSRILMLMELISCCVILFFFLICTLYHWGLPGGRWGRRWAPGELGRLWWRWEIRKGALRRR